MSEGVRLRVRGSLLLVACLVLMPASVLCADPTIAVDGYGFDWPEWTRIFEDPAGDAEDGFLDLTNVHAFASEDGLFFLAEVAIPGAPLVQFDLILRVGDRSFMLSAGPYDGMAYAAEVTESYDAIGDTVASRFAFGQAWEGFVSAGDLPAAGTIELVDIRVMVGVCCGESWRTADRLEASMTELEHHPVQRVEDPAAYAGQGMTWADAGMRLRGLAGYELDHVWASSFALPFQIAGLPDGSIATGDRERSRILRVAETGVSTLAVDVNANWVAVLPDGRLAYYSRTGTPMALDLSTMEAKVLFNLPGIDYHRSPIAVDANGRFYGFHPGTRTLIRTTSAGGIEPASAALPYPMGGVTDIEVAADGTVYVAGYSQVVAIDSAGGVRTVADDLHYEPVFLDFGADGTLYINELAKGFQAYSPSEGTLRSIDNGSGFQDFVIRGVKDATFFDANGAFFRMDLETGERAPIARADTLNSFAFAADSHGGLYAATASIPPWGAHIVHLSPDGSVEELSGAAYWYISSADVDASGRLCYVADDALHRIETNGAVSSWNLNLPGSDQIFLSSLACAPDGTWIILVRTHEEVRVYRVAEGGQGQELAALRFDRSSFGASVAQMDDARVDIGTDGRITMIVTARGTMQHGPFIQRIYQASADGTGLSEIANRDCQRVAGMVDVAVDPSGSVYALCVTGDSGDGDWIFRIDPGETPKAVVLIDAGRDPRSMDVGADGTIWFGTTLGVFRAYPGGE